MAFPLIPVLVGGAVAAAVVTYFITNRNAQKRISVAAQDMGDSVQAGADKIKDIVSDTVDDASQAAKDAASSVKNAASDIID